MGRQENSTVTTFYIRGVTKGNSECTTQQTLRRMDFTAEGHIGFQTLAVFLAFFPIKYTRSEELQSFNLLIIN